MKQQLFKYGWGVIFLLALLYLQWIPRDQFWELLSVFLIAFVSYAVLISRHRSETNFLLAVSSIAVVSFFFSKPLLSEDVYRFLWDGKLWGLGINPYALSPAQISHQDPFLTELYNGMTDLTKNNYTCYPPFNQLYFYLAALTSKVSTGIMILKALTVATLVPGMIYLRKLLIDVQLDQNLYWFIALNPLFLIETLGNLHFEGVMMSFLMIAFYYLRRNLILASIFFSLAVQIKLLPLIVLPFFLRFIGFKKTVQFGIHVLALTIAAFLPLMNWEYFLHFLESLRLYFGVFEFNSFIPHYLQTSVQFITDFNPIRYTSPLLSVLVFATLLYFSLYRRKESWMHLFEDLTLGLLIYFLLNSTVHPWYLIFILFLYPFTQQRSVLLWSFLIILSYGFYSMEETVSRWLINLEYLMLIISVYFELKNRRSANAYDRAS